jgi:hypothetical protein
MMRLSDLVAAMLAGVVVAGIIMGTPAKNVAAMAIAGVVAWMAARKVGEMMDEPMFWSTGQSVSRPVWAGVRWNRALAWEARGRLMEGRPADEVLEFVLEELEK